MTRHRYVISLSDEQAEVLDAVAYLNGYTGRAGAWIGDQIRSLVAQAESSPEVRGAVNAARCFRGDRPQSPDRIRHGLGVIDGGP